MFTTSDTIFLVGSYTFNIALTNDDVSQLWVNPPVATFGLATAIRSTAARAGQRIHLLELPTARVDAAAEAVAYYVFLEAVTNAQKHAPHAMVRVRIHATNRALTIEVSDDGPGGADEAPGGGLEGLRERVEASGGTFRLQSSEQSGTTVAATLPL